MAISTYTELQTAAANWLSRADLTSRIPEFVALAEAKLQRELTARDMETKNAAFSITGEFVAVPADFIEARSFDLNTTPRQPLRFMPLESQTDYFGVTGVPKYYAVVGANFRFAPNPNATVSATLVYYAKIPSLLSNSTNWLLTAHPDVYLYGTVLEAEAFLQDDPRLGIWKTAYDEAVRMIKKQGNRGRWGGNSMTMRPERFA